MRKLRYGTVHLAGIWLTKSLHRPDARISFQTTAESNTTAPALELDMTVRSKTAVRVTNLLASPEPTRQSTGNSISSPAKAKIPRRVCGASVAHGVSMFRPRLLRS